MHTMINSVVLTTSRKMHSWFCVELVPRDVNAVYSTEYKCTANVILQWLLLMHPKRKCMVMYMSEFEETVSL